MSVPNPHLRIETIFVYLLQYTAEEMFYFNRNKSELDVEGVVLVGGVSRLPVQHWHNESPIRSKTISRINLKTLSFCKTC